MNKKSIWLIVASAILFAGLSILLVVILSKKKEETGEAATDSQNVVDRSKDQSNGQTEDKQITEEGQRYQEDMVFKEESEDEPDWVLQQPNYEEGPWHSQMMIATSDDGLTFSEEKMFLEHSGVPNLILTSDGKLIATFQYFSYTNPMLFDVIAYSVSEDNGQTWSPVTRLEINGLGGADPGRPSNTPNACDPTLVELEDGTLRLYFTHHLMEEEYPQLYSAVGSSIDSIFESEGPQLETADVVLDPAVIYFEGKWHHYTVYHEKESPDGEVSLHSVSDDGTDFEIQEDIYLEMGFLGDVVEVDGGLRFYGGERSAFSSDGYAWEMDDGERVRGADPGVAILPDSSYIIIYTEVGPR